MLASKKGLCPSVVSFAQLSADSIIIAISHMDSPPFFFRSNFLLLLVQIEVSLASGDRLMEFPLEPFSPTWEQGQSSVQDSIGISDPDADNSALRSQPRFRVKRWRRDPPQPQSLVACPKASVTSPRFQLNRWEEGLISPHYKPSGGIALSVGGLAPPSLPRRAGSFVDHTCGGLSNVSLAPSTSM